MHLNDYYDALGFCLKQIKLATDPHLRIFWIANHRWIMKQKPSGTSL